MKCPRCGTTTCAVPRPHAQRIQYHAAMQRVLGRRRRSFWHVHVVGRGAKRRTLCGRTSVAHHHSRTQRTADTSRDAAHPAIYYAHMPSLSTKKCSSPVAFQKAHLRVSAAKRPSSPSAPMNKPGKSVQFLGSDQTCSGAMPPRERVANSRRYENTRGFFTNAGMAKRVMKTAVSATAARARAHGATQNC